jgi:hypothetical protein
MTDAIDQRQDEDCSASLYVDIHELRRRINPKIGRDRFAAKIRVLMEKRGFPRDSEFWGGWYWPKVRTWLDNDNGLANDDGTDSITHTAEDGPEDFDAAPKRKTRLQARPAPPAVLDREAGGAGHPGLSGQVHRLTPRGR